MPDRRAFLKSAAACAPTMALSPHSAVAQSVAGQSAGTPSSAPPPLLPSSIPVDALPQHFDVDRSISNWENAYWGVMPRVTAAAYAEHILYVNHYNSLLARNVMAGHPLYPQLEAARTSVADLLRVHADEIAFTRNGSEGLQSLIVNYRRLKAGDAVLYCDLDYDNMIAAMNYLGDHRGAQVVRFDMPEPATTANILAAYDSVLKRTPNAKLLLLTHVSNRTGLVLPVRDIVAMARARGVDTILDAAHAIGCLDVIPADTGADFIGWSMHKWLAAPLGLGAIYVRRDRIADLDPSYDNPDYPPTDLRARVPAGTVNFACELSVPTAIAFHRAIGPTAKERHLRSLRDAWVSRVRDLPGMDITVPDDPTRYCAITSIRLRGMRTMEDAERLQHRLLDRHKVLTVARKGVAQGAVLRVTPGLYTTHADVNTLVAALEAEHAMFA